jgi:two-component system, OmpR family, sensor kinase
MFRTLYAKLAAVLLGLFLLFGLFHVASTVVTTRLYLQEVDQHVNRTLAASLSKEEILMTNGRINQKALERVFHLLMVINPAIELYLLDPSGRILAFSAPPGTVKRERVDLEPIRAFLAHSRRLPILGDDPRGSDRQKVFSVAELPARGSARPTASSPPQGFLYVILGSEKYETEAAPLRGSYVLRQSARAGIAVVILTSIAGLVLFHALTGRLRRLTARVERFTKDGVLDSSPADVPSRGHDEIDQLNEAFRLMANRIGAQVRELKETDELRRELVANVSHDLRTPLAALRGYLETLLLKEGSLSPEKRRAYLETAARHSESLGKLVSELFELATLNSRATLPELEPFSLTELVSDVTQKFRFAAERKGVALRATPPEELPFALGNIAMIERVLENLIDNALRFTPAGGAVTVAVEQADGALSVTVSDTGTGIAAEDLPRIFDRFYRAAGRDMDPDGGAGLGLAIAQRILELHGGRIEVESAPGAGSRFRFRLSAAALDAASAGAAVIAPASPRALSRPPTSSDAGWRRG